MPASAGTIWTNAASGFWQENTNWTGGAPTNMAEVWITNAVSKTVTVNPDTPLENLSPYKLWLWAPVASTNTVDVTDLTSDHALQFAGTVAVGRNGVLNVGNSTLRIDSSLTISNLGTLNISNSSVDITAGNNLNVYGGNLALYSGSLSVTDPATRARAGRSTNGTITIHEGTMHLASDLILGESYNRSVGTLRMHGGRAQVDGMLSLSEGTGSTGTVFMTGGELSVTNGTNGILRIGNTGFGQALVSNATVRATVLMMGEDPTGFGFLSLQDSKMFVGGFAELTDFTNIVRIGDNGRAQVVVTNSTLVLPNTSIGRHINANGTLTVGDNGIVSFIDDVSVGRFSGSTGVVNVVGGQLNCTNAPIWVGRDGVGFLNVTNGQLRAEEIMIARVPTNTARGTFTLAGGVAIANSKFILGDANLSTGSVSVVGGTLAVANHLKTAILEVASGTMTVNGGTSIVDTLYMTNVGAQLNFHAGTIQVGNSVVANGSPFIVGDGVQPATLYLMQGTNVFADGLVISPNATVTGCGTIIGNVINYGTLTNDCVSGTAPVIVDQPQSQTVSQGEGVVFSVLGSGSEPLTYQWRLGGAPIPGANSHLYSIEAATTLVAGDYDVVLQNDFGTVTSSVATLTLVLPPQITLQPVGTTVWQGSAITLSVAATGEGPLQYQWRFNEADISGQTRSSLALNNLQTADAGSYTVEVSNSAGSMVSDAAVLRVFTLPQITKVKASNSVAQVFFTTESGALYRLEYQDELGSSNWLAVPFDLNGTGNIEFLSDTNATPALRIYRVRAD